MSTETLRTVDTDLSREFRRLADEWFDRACAATDADDWHAAAVATARSETWKSAAEAAREVVPAPSERYQNVKEAQR